jgi:O-antigen ligase
MTLHRVFFYLTVLLLPTQLGKHFFPDWALVLGRRLDYLSPTIFLTDITIMLTLASWFFSSFSSFKIKNYWKFVAFVGFVVLNIFFAASPLVAFSKWLKILEFVLFGFYIIKTKPSFSRSLWCLSFAVFYSSLIAIAQFFLQHSIGSLFWFLGERTFDITTPGIARIQLLPISLSPYLPIHPSSVSELLRPYATFPHPNVLGGFLAVALPLIIFNNMTPLFNKLLLSQRVKRLSLVDKAKPWAQRTIGSLKLFRVSTIILGCFTLILTFSRSAWVAGIIGLFILLFLHFRSIKNYLFIGFVVFIGFVGLLWVLPYFQTLTPENESVYVRNELSNAAISIWKTSPIIGVGLGNFLVELPKYYPHREIFFLQPVHNIYLLILSETGLIGFGMVLYFLFKLFKHIARQRLFVICLPAIGSCRRQVQAGLLSFVILLLLGAVDHYPLTLQQGQLLFTLLISLSLIDYKNGWRG